jgi:dihydropteroate synthase
MGIVNVTPDSFSDGGLYLDADAAIEHGKQLAAEGADILDIGGESTRPGAAEVSAEDELARTAPVVAALADHEKRGQTPFSISIDTSKATVAQAALDAGASIVNDVTALRADPELAGICAGSGCEVVLMHMLGTPRTMQDDPRYDDVVDDVKAFLAERIEHAVGEGIAEDRIWIDPGIGFGKTVEHNLELTRRLGELSELGRPVVFGSSRKSHLGTITGREVGERLGATIASNVLAVRAGADVLRVHDVAELREAVLTTEVIAGHRDWRVAASE